jgi:ribosomal protein S18 acetylase RimI-like enzyme
MEYKYEWIYLHCDEKYVRNVYVMLKTGLAFVRVTLYKNRKSADISSLCVDTAFRGKGFGNAALHEAEIVAKSIGATRVVLLVKKGWIVEWYKRNGYNIKRIDKIGKSVFYDMEKEL